MGRTALIVFAILSFFGTAVSQPYKGKIEQTYAPVLNPHFQEEYTFDKPVDPARWTKEQPGLHVSFGSTNRLYFRTEVPDLQPTLSWSETGWRGERLNAAMVVWSPDTLEQIHFTAGDLTNAKGQTLSKSNIKFHLVHYVLSNYPYGAKNVDCGPTPYPDVYLMPDRFEDFDRFDLPGQTVRSVWITLDIPAGTEPGLYTGTVSVKSGRYNTTLNLNVTVQPPVLPKPSDWKFRLDLWQNPWVVAWYYHLKPWSEEHKALLKKHLKLYADAGGKYITTYAVHSPWADNSYWIEGAMIEWIKQANGTWKFDYTIFDDYVALAMEAGIDDAITVYTPVPWENRFRYLDEKTGEYKYERWPPGSEAFKTFSNTFLTDLKAHLEKKGWFGKTYLGINENPMEQTLAAINAIKAHSKEWRITYAGDWHEELTDLLDDYSYLYGKEPTVAQAKARAGKGFTSTYYVCCNPAKPNNFVFSPPIEGRWISWYSAAYGYDGFLRWAYDAWPENPTRDARHGSWAAGDCYLIYPGGNSCIRYEKLREGIADFEKINILRERASRTSDKNVKKLWQELEQHLKTFTQEKEFDEKKITDAVAKGESLLDRLSELLPR